MRKLPIGIQGFEKLRTEGFLYVDKSQYIDQLAGNSGQYFLSRPRRFGKSLFLSSLKAYWEGKKDLFRGCEVEAPESSNQDKWIKYPVFLFDFNGQNYREKGALEEALDIQLKRWEKDYHLTNQTVNLGERFQNLLSEARSQTGLRSVILVDEYDKPLLETMDIPELEEHNKSVFKGFFSTLKGFDEYIQFVFITGVTRFEKVSIFSDLNQLRDISFSREYAGICGITEEEMHRYFGPEIEALAADQELTVEECLHQLRQTYDGYHFHPKGEGVYNPFSLLNAFADREFRSYWFSTDTPTFLVRKIKDSGFDVQKLTNRTLYAAESTLSDYKGEDPDPVPLLYQAGYLTIVDYDRFTKSYTLSFPNEEVKYGMLESLMPEYTPACRPGYGTDIFSLRQYIDQGDIDNIRNTLTALFASIPYTQDRNPFEHYFQTVIYLIFTLLGRFARCEMHTFTGRIDCTVETGDFVYLFEFKRDDTPEAALHQIDEMGYALPFAADARKLYKIGVTFDSSKRILNGWKVREE